jgi:ribosome biogenesis GTPase A
LSKAFVRDLPNVKVLSPEVGSNRIISTGPSPGMMALSVKSPMIKRAGIVRLIVAITDPNRILTDPEAGSPELREPRRALSIGRDYYYDGRRYDNRTDNGHQALVTIFFPESPSRMSIQWFPGHMNTARREAAKTMEVIDVVVEVLDARIPHASCNPLIEELRLARQRPSLKVLNKADVADPAVTQAWLDQYNRQPGVSAAALSCRYAGDADKILQFCQPLAPHRNSSAKPLRLLIMGVPNVGKSTLMNMLLKRRIARVGDEPAVTRVQQRHKLNDRMAITDSPGLLWGTIKDPHVGLLLATINAVGHTVVDDETVAEFLAAILLSRYSARLTTRYGFAVEGLRPTEVIDAIARKRGCLLTRSGGGLDRDKAARILLSDYRNGTLGRTSLETPDRQVEEHALLAHV